MTNWEYKTINPKDEYGNICYGLMPNHMDNRKINDDGKDGWEWAGTYEGLIVLKRRLKWIDSLFLRKIGR